MRLSKKLRGLYRTKVNIKASIYERDSSLILRAEEERLLLLRDYMNLFVAKLCHKDVDLKRVSLIYEL